MYSRFCAGTPVMRASVFSGNRVGRPHSQPVPAAGIGARVQVKAAGSDGRDIDAGQRFIGQLPARVNGRCRGEEAYQDAGRVAAQIPHFGSNHTFGARGQPVIRGLQVVKAESLDGELFGVVPIEFRRGGRSLGQEGCGAERE